MKSVLLMGPPGSGKTQMIVKTAIRSPIHFIDSDRKLASNANFVGEISKGRVTYWELDEPLIDKNLTLRLSELAKNKSPGVRPRGWDKFATLVDKLDKDDEALKAGTWAIDSVSRLGDHQLRLILHEDPKGNAALSPRNWMASLMMWKETITILIDLAKQYDKDLILTVHERTFEMPGENTKVIYNGDERQFLGVVNLKITPSLSGQFGNELAAYFDEFYGLEVQMVSSNPTWKCRVKPDGKRDLRTSFDVGDKVYFDPDFRQIWK